MTDPIRSFADEHRFLLNFARVSGGLTALGMAATSAEHIYQAAKTTNLDERADIISQRSPGKAKQAGERLTLRPNWDQLRLPLMERIVAAKFDPVLHPDLVDGLLATGDAELIKGNNLGDLFWGADSTTWAGENHLGKILMARREQLRAVFRP